MTEMCIEKFIIRIIGCLSKMNSQHKFLPWRKTSNVKDFKNQNLGMSTKLQTVIIKLSVYIHVHVIQ